MSFNSGITAALVAFQAELPRIGKSSTAQVRSEKGSYQYGYADLAEVSAEILPALAKVGIAYSAPLVRTSDQTFVLNAQLRHISGETIDCEWPVAVSSPQNMGSAITYGRRYCLLAMTGVHPAGEDDDGALTEHKKLAQDTVSTGGRKATRSKTTRGQDDEWTTNPSPPAARQPVLRTEEQSRAIHAALTGLKITDRTRGLTLIARLAGRESLPSTKELTRAEASAVMVALRDIESQDDPMGAADAVLGGEHPAETPARQEPPPGTAGPDPEHRDVVDVDTGELT